jgi:hypothetical protein
MVSGIYGIKISYEEALIEKNLNHDTATSCPPIALFSHKYYNEINELNHNKIYDDYMNENTRIFETNHLLN